MRRTIVLTAATAALMTAVLGAQPVPPPVLVPKGVQDPLPPGVTSPDPAKLRADVAALAEEREKAAKEVGTSSLAGERAALRAQMLELLKRLADRPPEPGLAPRMPTVPRKTGDFKLPDGATALDSVRMAENLFRTGDTNAAYGAFRLIDTSALSREDRAFVQYMTACCLRKMNKRADAAVVYREVAAAREDDFIADCAVWQISLINSTLELEAQLAQLRSRAKGP